jgi:hypothetical protein
LEEFGGIPLVGWSNETVCQGESNKVVEGALSREVSRIPRATKGSIIGEVWKIPRQICPGVIQVVGVGAVNWKESGQLI